MPVWPFLLGVLPFALAMSLTPGPNNLMLASGGARFGWRNCLPHKTGVVVGFAVMMICVGVGIAGLIPVAPGLYTVMKAASIAVILLMAWQTARAETNLEGGGGRPMRFLAAAGFQWINPKAWIITVTAMATYIVPSRPHGLQIALLTLAFALTGAVSSSAWVLFGQMLRHYLTSHRRQMMFNWSMAALLVASILPALFER